MEIRVDDLPVYVYTGARPFDPGRPGVVFLHGGGLDHTVWLLQSRYLAHHGWNALAADLPGHGRSGGEPLPRIEDMADWVVRLMDALELGSASVVGHSMGALVALETGARHPGRVDALALIGVAVPMAVAEPLLEAARANHHDAIEMITGWGHSGPARIGGNTAPGMWMTGNATRLLERARPGVLFNDLNACNAYARGLEAAGRVQCPVLVLLGGRDQMAPPRGAGDVIDALPSPRVQVLPRCGHMHMAEEPDAVLDALLEFLDNPPRPDARAPAPR